MSKAPQQGISRDDPGGISGPKRQPADSVPSDEQAQSDPADAMTKRNAAPLFPLGNLILPGGILELRIFEPRYIDMVRHCTRAGESFVICLSERGDDGMQSRPRQAGCCVQIIDFDTLDDGQLGITVVGQDRVTIDNPRQQDDGLWLGDLTPLGEEPDQETPENHEHLGDMATRFLEELGGAYEELEPEPLNASWVGFRLTELLPLHPDVKQDLLESLDPLERLDRLDFLIAQMVMSAQS